MMQLSSPAMEVIKNYLTLPIHGHTVPCPYYNNRRQNVHGGLRVLVGKGSPEEIASEAALIALREKTDFVNFKDDDIKKFLIDNHLGVDCSALAYYILDAELQAQGLGKLQKHLNFLARNPLRAILTRFRPVENTSVEVFVDDKNSKQISLSDINPGDFIIWQGSGDKKDRDHILVIHEVGPGLIKYTHATQWLADGSYNHGVRQGEIKIVDASKSILDQTWLENNKTGRDNETHAKASQAATVETRRLHILCSIKK